MSSGPPEEVGPDRYSQKQSGLRGRPEKGQKPLRGGFWPAPERPRHGNAGVCGGHSVNEEGWGRHGLPTARVGGGHVQAPEGCCQKHRVGHREYRKGHRLRPPLESGPEKPPHRETEQSRQQKGGGDEKALRLHDLIRYRDHHGLKRTGRLRVDLRRGVI